MSLWYKFYHATSNQTSCPIAWWYWTNSASNQNVSNSVYWASLTTHRTSCPSQYIFTSLRIVYVFAFRHINMLPLTSLFHPLPGILLWGSLVLHRLENRHTLACARWNYVILCTCSKWLQYRPILTIVVASVVFETSLSSHQTIARRPSMRLPGSHWIFALSSSSYTW